MELWERIRGGIGHQPIEQLDSGQLAERLAELEKAASYLEAERSRCLRLLVERRGHHELDYPSPTAFLMHRCRISPQRATRLVAIASALGEMPQTDDAWQKGCLALDQVRQLVHTQQVNPAVFAEQERSLVEAVAHLPVVATGRALSYWRQAVDHQAAEADAEQQFGRRRIHLSQTFEGMWRLDGWLDPLSGETLNTALQGALPPRAADDSRTPAQRRADALIDLARSTLDEGRLPQQGGEKPHLLVLVGADRLHPRGERNSVEAGTGVGESVDGSVFTQSVLEVLACDCSVSRIVFGPGSEVIDLGRKTRVIPAGLRRAVIARDRHCQHLGCYRPAKWCDVDHIVSWLDGGETKLSNLQLLCRYHHRLKHIRQRHHPASTLPAGATQPSLALTLVATSSTECEGDTCTSPT